MKSKKINIEQMVDIDWLRVCGQKRSRQERPHLFRKVGLGAIGPGARRETCVS